MEYYLILIALYLCIFLPMITRQKARVAKKARNRRRGVIKMNEIIEKYLHKTVAVQSQSSFGVVGVITDVKDNWIELEQKNGKKTLINTDYITTIEERVEKKK